MTRPTFSATANGGYVYWMYRDRNGLWHQGRATSFEGAIVAAGHYGFRLDRGGE